MGVWDVRLGFGQELLFIIVTALNLAHPHLSAWSGGRLSGNTMCGRNFLISIPLTVVYTIGGIWDLQYLFHHLKTYVG